MLIVNVRRQRRRLSAEELGFETSSTGLGLLRLTPLRGVCICRFVKIRAFKIGTPDELDIHLYSQAGALF